MAQEYDVEVQSDFLEGQTKAQPVAAVAELIWNGLDADATRIIVDFEYDKLGGMSKIVVSDNGDGIPYAEAPTLFRNLGGSWKKPGAHTEKARSRGFQKNLSSLHARSSDVLYIDVLVARRPVMEKVADKPGLFAAR
jgi:hypothetical protein